MSYEVKDDEVAVIVKPVMDEEGKWTLELATGLAFGEISAAPMPAAHAAFEAALSMAASLTFLADYPEFEEELIEYKQEMLKDIFPEQYAAAEKEISDAEKEEVYSKKGNVYTLNAFTKTQGNA
jgi:hypothetical protein